MYNLVHQKLPGVKLATGHFLIEFYIGPFQLQSMYSTLLFDSWLAIKNGPGKVYFSITESTHLFLIHILAIKNELGKILINYLWLLHLQYIDDHRLHLYKLWIPKLANFDLCPLLCLFPNFHRKFFEVLLCEAVRKD